MARIETKELSPGLAAFNEIAKKLQLLSEEDRMKVLKMLDVFFYYPKEQTDDRRPKTL